MNKKALLVVPALGVLLLAAAGSVGGTVAWFSSVSSINTEVSTFKAQALDGNLELKFTAGNGTTTSDNNNFGNTLATATNSVLTHASYDHVAEQLYTRSSESKGGVRNVTSNPATWLAKADYDGESGHNMYFAYSWDMTFQFSWASETAVNLYFDSSSIIEATSNKTPFSDSATYSVDDIVSYDSKLYRCIKAITTGHAFESTEWVKVDDTINGFRIAFVADSTNSSIGNIVNTRVWANKRSDAAEDDTKPHYIKKSAVDALGDDDDEYYEDGSEYTGNLIDSRFNDDKKAEGVAITENETTNLACFGQFYRANRANKAPSQIRFKCVAWFEGTDPSVVTSSAMDQFKATMKFYAREATGSGIPTRS